MYAKGMTTSDIETHIRDIYGISVSDSTVSRITDKILPIAKEWQQRPLEPIYAVVFLDAIHYHVRSEGQIVKKAVYIAIGVNLDGRKDVLGMWVGENESAKFWATVLNSLKNRGIEDIFIACTDNLTGFDAAIHAVFPQTEIQNCIIHQLRNSSKYVSYKDLKALMADLKAVYAAVDEQAALDALDAFGERWDKKYPKISQSWRANWANLSTYFKYPQEVRRLIYTTNAIEGFNRQLRKVTKAKSVFPTDDSLLKMLYLAMMDITKKMDWAPSGLESDPRPDGHILCRAHAGVTPPGADVKGKMNVSAQQPPVYAQNPVGLANLPGSFIRNQASPDISSVLQRGSRASGAPGFRGMAFCHNRAGGSAPAAGIHRAPHHWPWPFPPANIQWRWTPLP